APPPDTTNPTVSLTFPASGANVSGTVTIAASASDNIGVTKVDFMVNGVTVGSDLSSPYTYVWSTIGLSGNQTLSARAYDAAGNAGLSSPITVNVVQPPPPPPDTIPNPGTLRDNFDNVNGPLSGTKKWVALLNAPLGGSMWVNDSTMVPKIDSGYYSFGGIVWDTLEGAGTEASLTVRQKGGDYSYSSLFIYGRMNNKDFNNGTGYRLRFLEQSGTDVIEIHRVGPGYASSTVLASVNYEINAGDVLTFRILSDNKTMIGLVNGVKMITAFDTTYTPTSWYFAFRACVLPSPIRFDEFKVSTRPVPVTPSPLQVSPANGATGVSTNPTLSWSQVATATSYRLQVSMDSSFATTIFDDSTITATSATISSLANSVTYYWRVSASSVNGISAYSSVSRFTTVNGNMTLTVNRKNIDFGKVAVGRSKTDSIILGNSGSSALTISKIQTSSTQYFVNPTTTIISPGSQQKVFVIFAPTQKATTNGLVVSVCDSAGLIDTVFVAGRGVSPPHNSRSPGSIVFRTIPLGASLTDSFLVSNTGELDLTISDVQSTNPVFRVAPTTAVIAPGDSQSFHVTATPTQAKPEQGYLIFHDNSPENTDSMEVQITAVTGVEPSETPLTFALMQNYPNPFNPSTIIQYSIPEVSKVTLKVFDILGQEIRTLVDDVQGPGIKSVQWDSIDRNGRNIGSGYYFYRIVMSSVDDPGESFSQVRKMLLLK
ncbi:MAG: choice-of-anchor D domain-containing protein, partial [Ignavibacteria bacterium]|nr:choice-of-anchor D domain-containing protein [Ignavibacteria bacterium]